MVYGDFYLDPARQKKKPDPDQTKFVLGLSFGSDLSEKKYQISVIFFVQEWTWTHHAAQNR